MMNRRTLKEVQISEWYKLKKFNELSRVISQISVKNKIRETGYTMHRHPSKMNNYHFFGGGYSL